MLVLKSLSRLLIYFLNQLAYEIVTDPVKRRQFDSVDPEFDESIPTKCSKEDFFEVLTPVFERNARYVV